MHGNVWEWCEDWYVDNYSSTPRDGSANYGGSQKKRVLRGGSWNNIANDIRSAARNRGYTNYRYFSSVFRLLWEP
jgi:formylglycine-generating enzyme required for sulfatase activity